MDIKILKMFSFTRSVVGLVVLFETHERFFPRNRPLIIRISHTNMVSINIKTVLRNIKTMRSHLEKGVRFCAVVKANAYGQGDVLISRAIQSHIDMFAVARMSEALRLRAAEIFKPILLFGVCEDYKNAIINNIIVTIGSISEMKAACLASGSGKLCVHVKVNTGMNRFGINTPWQLRNILSYAEKYPNINICGLYTHFSHECTTPEGVIETDKQLKRFTTFRTIMRHSHPHAIVHAACSGSSHYKPAQFDMVRVGKAMYGGFEGYRTAASVQGKIVAVRHLQKSNSFGYGSKFTASGPITIGIVSCGYSEAGYLLLGHTDHVFVDKKPCKILGTICMDVMAIDVSQIVDPLNKTVTILGDQKGARITDFTVKSGLSGATLLCSLTQFQ